MNIEPQTVQAMADLARLDIPSEQLAHYQHDLEQILSYMQQLSQVDTTGVEPLAHPLDLPTSYREDVVTESDQRSLMQSQAPAAQEGYYLVPQVVPSQ